MAIVIARSVKKSNLRVHYSSGVNEIIVQLKLRSDVSLVADDDLIAISRRCHRLKKYKGGGIKFTLYVS